MKYSRNEHIPQPFRSNVNKTINNLEMSMLQVPKLDKINASPQRTEDEHTCRINKQWERDALVVTVVRGAN